MGEACEQMARPGAVPVEEARLVIRPLLLELKNNRLLSTTPATAHAIGKGALRPAPDAANLAVLPAQERLLDAAAARTKLAAATTLSHRYQCCIHDPETMERTD